MIRSQDLNKRYYDAGMFYIYSKDVIFNLGSAGSDENIPYFISKGSAIDIDDDQDWQFAEKLFKLNKMKREESELYKSQIHNLIPGGAHTYSKVMINFPTMPLLLFLMVKEPMFGI